MAFLAAYVVFFTALFTSIVMYRLSPLHPLAKYPGPIACRISQLWAVVIYSGGKAHYYRKLLHDQYGPIVRIGTPLMCVTLALLMEVKGQTNYLLLTKICFRTSSARKECQGDLVRFTNMAITSASRSSLV